MRPVLFAAALASGILVSGLTSGREDPVTAGVRAYSDQKYSIAAQLLGAPAEQGDPIAETYLGFMYQHGRGVPQDYALAAHWYQAAAEQGQPSAQFCLAMLYNRGLGVRMDFVTAEMWFNLAVSRADPRERDYWTRMRNAVASKLTAEEFARANAWAVAFATIRAP